MDKQFELAAIKRGAKINEYRSFIGPKGWLIEYNKDNNQWLMTHNHYKDLSLTMLEPDIMPIGRHTWSVANNVCNQGRTNDVVLQISGCQDRQFTCDDGKCIHIDQRCNNIEVCSSSFQI